MAYLFQTLLISDVRTLINVLFLGNVVSVLLIISFSFSSPFVHNQALSVYYSLAELLQACAYLFLVLRGEMADVYSIHIGNTLLFLGFFLRSDVYADHY